MASGGLLRIARRCKQAKDREMEQKQFIKHLGARGYRLADFRRSCKASSPKVQKAFLKVTYSSTVPAKAIQRLLKSLEPVVRPIIGDVRLGIAWIAGINRFRMNYKRTWR